MMLPTLATFEIKCNDREREALLKFKEDIGDVKGVLSSWESDQDCCKWREIRCDNETNHVTALDFRGLITGKISSSLQQHLNHLDLIETVFPIDRPRFEGIISSSLLELQHLNYLDLGNIDLHVTKFPEFIGHLSRLKYLDLSGNDIEGAIPHQLGNLSELQHLHLSGSYSTNLDWLYTLHSLEYLDLSSVNLSQVTNWLQALTKVLSLRELHLRSCDLPEILSSSHPTMNFSSLAILDLSSNSLSPHSIYSWMFNLSGSISYVDLSSNSLQGSIPDAFRNMASLSYLSMNMASLSYLSLSNNQIEGGIPRFFGNLSLETLNLAGNKLDGEFPHFPEVMKNLSERRLKHLGISENRLNGSLPDSITMFSSLIELKLSGNKINGLLPEHFGNLFNLNVLDLSNNQLCGTLPKSIGRLSKLEILNLASNHLEGIISEVNLFNLSMLRELDLSFNSFQFKISSGFVPPFQLESILLANCKQGPQFPEWLRTQHNFSYIDLSGAEISDTIPAWFWDLSSTTLVLLNFSYNQIYGVLPDLTSKFSGRPSVLDLSSNNLEGTLPPLPPSIFTLNLFENRFSGSLESLCNSGALFSLDISDNLLSGKFPDCFQHKGSIFIILNLANNNLSGSIFPVGPECRLESLNLRNNSFGGEFPQSFRSCRDLQVIDLGENKLSGSIPAWIGGNWPSLVILSLRSNELYGEVPSSICHMKQLQILDLSLNKINGTIPKCFNNLTAMAQERSLITTITLSYPSFLFGRGFHVESAFIMWKRVESEYKNILGLVKFIDLSSNHLTGGIPNEITSLVGLFGLNLSTNFINGFIPPQIGGLHLLNFLDLSRNNLSGGIPISFSQLTHLGVLDLSYNNLSGRIPSSTQLQTFNVSVYTGNSGLCGKPVTDTCPGDEVITRTPEKTGDHDEEDTFITSGFYISLGLGFVFGFLGICGSLLLNKSWRHKIFKVDSVHHWLY
ncbi:hypothetical protein BUALT_BualtUnG0028800 [Buddleja alternifolia]|uniref:Leucine-rich repeat-containing N-terminal plant-type domain-containing protein n=1 Tax=Buddleja alternifolia TaxID=168488 RepID=A0AAV6W0W8_9LAMI|nr:hypothetical protein BUALT_BualtUnG0028800 [Buddleja alternifolia]